MPRTPSATPVPAAAGRTADSAAMADILPKRLCERLGREIYDTWLRDCRFSLDGRALIVSVPTKFVGSYVKQNFGDAILVEVQALVDSRPVLRISVGAPLDPDTEATPAPPPAEIFRSSIPEIEAQGDFFIPDLSEVALKDDVHLMEIAPFTLQPRGEKRTELSYKTVNGMEVRITANPKYGLPTSDDYDIVLMVQSWLADIANQYRREVERYERDKAAGKHIKLPAPPPRFFEPTINEIIRFTRTRRGGVQHGRIVPALERLHHTVCRIDMAGRRKTRIGAFNFINGWDVITETGTGHVSQVRIHIPEWMYEGIVETKVPTILTYDRAYLLLTQPFLKALYRFIRLKVPADGGTFAFTTADLMARTNSRQSVKEFNRELRKNVDKVQAAGGLFGYHLELAGERETRALLVRKIVPLPEPSPNSV